MFVAYVMPNLIMYFMTETQTLNYIKVLIKYICGKSVKYPLNIMACNIKVKPIMK